MHVPVARCCRMSEKNHSSFSEFQEPNDQAANQILEILDGSTVERDDKDVEDSKQESFMNKDAQDGATDNGNRHACDPVPVAAVVAVTMNIDEADGQDIRPVSADTSNQQMYAVQFAELRREREKVLQLIQHQERRELERNKRSKKLIVVFSLVGIIVVVLIVTCLVILLRDDDDHDDDDKNQTLSYHDNTLIDPNE